MAFQEEYKKLNPEQRRAVDTIEGPMLVIAGPGTGKTQLLSMRVANIIRQTDIQPSNILCLTFTDNAARNMRQRLETIIGQAAYHVSIHTFHSFGVEIINQYPDYFTARQLLQQVDELGSYELLKVIFDNLPHSDPLSIKIGDEYPLLRDTLSTISWLKQNAVQPAELEVILKANQQSMDKLNPEVSRTFASPPLSKNLKDYAQLQQLIAAGGANAFYFGFPSYNRQCARELAKAIELTNTKGRYAPRITEWRNKWCLKTAAGQHVLKDSGRNLHKMQAVAKVYRALLESMSHKGLYDFDDMIMEVVQAIESSPELKMNLQERYQYILVDEFQDTNKAQLRLLTALGDNPLFEERPNIMAVGDDDQAIYAFQGAEVSNMAIFARQYQQPAIINLVSNYRSPSQVLEVSQMIANQISNRLTELPAVSKELVPEAGSKDADLEHAVLPSELAQYAWLAQHIARHIKSGVPPEEIAVLAPRHRYLERLVPYLGSYNLPVAYERRENILDAPIIVQLITMAKLVVALSEKQPFDSDAFLAEVLSYEFWGINNAELMQISTDSFNKHASWLTILMKHKNRQLRGIVDWFMTLSRRSTTEPLEYMLDSLLGMTHSGQDSEVDEAPLKQTKSVFVSPMREYYFSTDRYQTDTDNYLALLGQLSTLRQRLRAWKPSQSLFIADLVEFVNLHRQAHLKIIDTNPHTQTTNAVQVMTAYKAKGLEFEIVYIINAQDEVWGPTTRKATSRIKLPENMPIRPIGDDDNDRLRLLYVALTRAKQRLIISNYTHDLESRLSPALSFISDDLTNKTASRLLKPHVIAKPANAEAVEILATDWSYRFKQIIADKPTLFEPILANYKLSVTHLNNFTDLAGAGPDYFFMHNLLRFPEALTPAAAYGDAVHRTLQWFHSEFKQHGRQPSVKSLELFFTDMLGRKHLRSSDFKRLNKRGQQALARYIKAHSAHWSIDDLVERGFNNEGVIIAAARLSGKIDKIHFTAPGQIEVIDFKTGKPATNWQGRDEIEKIKLYKYRQQLLFYKLLIEHSASYAKKLTVKQGSLEFIEPDENNQLVSNLTLQFTTQEITRLSQLIGKIWQHIMALNIPNIDSYPKTLKGIQAFEDDLLEDKI